MSYEYFRTLNMDFNEANDKIRKALAEQGIGIITEIDVKETVKKKLDVDFRPYLILGACNPTFAHQVLLQEPDVGLLLPCNLILEDNQDGTVRLGAIDAKQMLSVTGRDDLAEMAEEVNARLKKAVDSL